MSDNVPKPLDPNEPSDMVLQSKIPAAIREIKNFCNTLSALITAGLSAAKAVVAPETSLPDVSACSVIKTSNLVPTTIENFINGYDGQMVTVIAGDANTTIAYNIDGIALAGRADVQMALGDAYTFVNDSGTWRQTHAIPILKEEVLLSLVSSPYTYINANANCQLVSVMGGTVSLMQVVRDGVAYNVTGCLFMLAPADALIITYTVAPVVNVLNL
jgi:hypothetical protein